MSIVAAQVIGNDTTVNVGGASGNFELNVMLPMVAHSLLESIRLLANASKNLAAKSVAHLSIRDKNIKSTLEKNPILVTSLNPLIGYDLASKIAKRAFIENRALKEVALEMCDLSETELENALDPTKMTKVGFVK